MSQRPVIPHGGWHLSYFGDKYFIERKIRRCLHEELDLGRIQLDTIEDRMTHQEDLYGRKGVVDFKNVPLEENTYLPLGYEVFLPDFV